jgi:hypothetical protein
MSAAELAAGCCCRHEGEAVHREPLG